LYLIEIQVIGFPAYMRRCINSFLCCEIRSGWCKVEANGYKLGA